VDAYRGLGCYLEAAAEFCTSLVYDPDHVPTLGNYGVALGLLGRRTDALKILERIIDTSSDLAEL
jgi:tetratricopeptide (TPR) repeat protein